MDAIAVGRDWTAEDYVDAIHPSEAGGVKLADVVAQCMRRFFNRDYSGLQNGLYLFRRLVDVGQFFQPLGRQTDLG